MELGSEEADDRFGWAIAIGNFDNDTRADVVVGAPGETMAINLQSGYGFTYLSTGDGLEGWHGIHQESR